MGPCPESCTGEIGVPGFESRIAVIVGGSGTPELPSHFESAR